MSVCPVAIESSSQREVSIPRPSKRQRFRREPDLEVEVEGKVFRLDSRVLMAASDVFTVMLECNMSECRTGRINLMGKKHTDFELLLQHLELRGGAAPPSIDERNIGVLLRWADEYDMGGLKNRCEEFLKSYLKYSDACKAMALSLEFRLDSSLSRELAELVAREPLKNRRVLVEYIDHPVVIEAIVPVLQRTVGLDQRHIQDASVTKSLWLIALKLMDREREWPGKAERDLYSKRARALEMKLKSLIPVIPLNNGDLDKMVTLDYVKSKCCSGSPIAGMRFDAQELETMLAYLIDKREVMKSEKSGKYYRGMSYASHKSSRHSKGDVGGGGMRFDAQELETLLAYLIDKRGVMKSEKSGKYYRGMSAASQKSSRHSKGDVGGG